MYVGGEEALRVTVCGSGDQTLLSFFVCDAIFASHL